MIVQTIKAQVNTKGLLKNTSALFSGEFKDIATELLQNSRRAGASQVEINVENNKITFKDNGTGIKDPSVILNVATSNWDEEIVHSEHPAGMGVMSLATRKEVTVRSQDWICELRPESFSGFEEVPIVRTESITGTSISFLLNDKELKDFYRGKNVWYSDLEDLVRYYPVNVSINGNRAKQSSFLHEGGNCLYVKEWKGLNIAVKRNMSRGAINFYGLDIYNHTLPVVYGEHGAEKYSVAVDVINCPELRLVLPARKEVVTNDFFEELVNECELTIYEAIAKDPKGHYLSYAHYLAAKKLGININESRPLLRGYCPYTSEGTILSRIEPTTVDSVILDYSLSRQSDSDGLFSDDEDVYNYMSVYVQKVLEDDGITDLREPDEEMSWYRWYRKITIYKPEAIVAIEDGVEKRINEISKLEDIDADELYIEFLKYRLDDSISEEIVRLEIPFIFLDKDGTRWTYPSERNTALIRNKNIEMPDYSEIKDLLENLYFDYDSDGDSLDTQLHQYHSDTRRWYISKFFSEEESLTSYISSTCEEFLYDLRRAHYEADIKVRRVKNRYGDYDMKLEVDLIKGKD